MQQPAGRVIARRFQRHQGQRRPLVLGQAQQRRGRALAALGQRAAGQAQPVAQTAAMTGLQRVDTAARLQPELESGARVALQHFHRIVEHHHRVTDHVQQAAQSGQVMGQEGELGGHQRAV